MIGVSSSFFSGRRDSPSIHLSPDPSGWRERDESGRLPNHYCLWIFPSSFLDISLGRGGGRDDLISYSPPPLYSHILELEKEPFFPLASHAKKTFSPPIPPPSIFPVVRNLVSSPLPNKFYSFFFFFSSTRNAQFHLFLLSPLLA